MMKPFSIDMKGKIAIITGGGSGIGQSIAQQFAASGAHVCVLDVNKDKGVTTVRNIIRERYSASFHEVDVSNQSLMVEVFKNIVEEFDRIDILVNNAGISHIGTVEQTSESDFQRVFNINVKGVYNGIFAAIPYMKKQNSGVILNMGSVASVLGLPDRFTYSMSKAAVENMTYTVARDYLNDNIRCNSIAPGRVHTPFVDAYLANNYPGKESEMFEALSKTQPIGRMGTPEEIAQLALYLCSDAASFITGTNVPIDGGFVKLNT